MSRKTAEARAELDALRRIHEADAEYEDFRRDMTRRMHELDARAQRMMDEKLAKWAAEYAQLEATVREREIRPPDPGEVQMPEPGWDGELSFDEYVQTIRPQLGIDAMGRDGLFW